MDTKFSHPYKADRALTAHIAAKLNITEDVEQDKGIRSIVHQIVHARQEFGRKAEQLEETSRRMAEDLVRTAEQATAASRNERYSINSLGVLQGRGPDVDRLCGELQILSDYLALIEGPWDCDKVGVEPATVGDDGELMPLDRLDS